MYKLKINGKEVVRDTLRDLYLVVMERLFNSRSVKIGDKTRYRNNNIVAIDLTVAAQAVCFTVFSDLAIGEKFKGGVKLTDNSYVRLPDGAVVRMEDVDTEVMKCAP